MAVKIDVKALEAKLEELVLSQTLKAIPGEEKLAIVVNDAARWLDDQTRWGFLGPLAIVAEAADFEMFRTLMWVPAQMAYNRVKAAGGAG